VDVIELLISAVIHYIVNFISILTEVLLLIKLAIVMGKALGALVPYLAALLVIPRVRTVAVVPVAIYLTIGSLHVSVIFGSFSIIFLGTCCVIRCLLWLLFISIACAVGVVHFRAGY